MTVRALPCVDRRSRLLALVLSYAVFAAVYLGAAHLGTSRAIMLTPGALDVLLPRLDWTVWVYMSQLPFLAVVLWRAPDAARSRVLGAMAVATLLAAAVFIAYPTMLPRHADLGQDATGALWSLLYLVDVPGNCFPSLHVALAALATRAVPAERWRTLAVAWAAAIALSTITTGQHLIIDVIGGLALAASSWLIVKRLPVARAQHG
jgi:membrane-associated phospholipid phosphatase